MESEDSKVTFNGSLLTYLSEARVYLSESSLAHLKEGRVELDRSSLQELLDEMKTSRDPITAEWVIEKGSPEYNNVMQPFNELRARCRECKRTDDET